MNSPKVTVCVVTYNQEKYIGHCLESIIFQETNFDFEVIVSDDASVDGTAQIVKKYADTYPNLIRAIFQETNIGACANYLLVHRAATGKYVAHLDGDDAMLPGKLRLQVETMDVNPKSPASFHLMECINSETISTGSFWLQDNYDRPMTLELILMNHPNIGHSSIMYQRTRMGNFLTECKFNFIDMHIYLYLARAGALTPINKVLGQYRVGVGISNNYDVLNLVFDAIKRYGSIGATERVVRAAGVRFARKFAYVMLRKKNHVAFLRFRKMEAEYTSCGASATSLVNLLMGNQRLFLIVASVLEVIISARSRLKNKLNYRDSLEHAMKSCNEVEKSFKKRVS